MNNFLLPVDEKIMTELWTKSFGESITCKVTGKIVKQDDFYIWLETKRKEIIQIDVNTDEKEFDDLRMFEIITITAKEAYFHEGKFVLCGIGEKCKKF